MSCQRAFLAVAVSSTESPYFASAVLARKSINGVEIFWFTRRSGVENLFSEISRVSTRSPFASSKTTEKKYRPLIFGSEKLVSGFVVIRNP